MVTQHGHEPWLMKLMSKRFYVEKVFDDSSSDRPKLRWRYRNFYSDNVVNGQRTQEHDSLSHSHSDSHSDYHGDYHSTSQSDSSDTGIHTSNHTDKRRINLEPKQSVRVLNQTFYLFKNQTECVFL